MSKGSKAPPPPDPVATANAQAAANADTARLQAQLNRVNQITPYGSLTYKNVGQDWIDQELERRRKAFVPGQTISTTTPRVWGATGEVDGEGRPIYGWIGGTSTTTTGPQAFDEAAVRAELEKINPYKDQWQAITELSPEQQAIFDEQTALSLALSRLANDYTTRIGEATRNPFSFEGLPDAPGADDAARQRIEASLFERLNPQLDRRREQIEVKLRNQGLMPGSEAWNNAMDDLAREENDLRLGVTAAGGREMANLFSLATTARQNAIQERLMERNQPINEVAALLGTSGGVQMPQFTNVPQTSVSPTDIIGPTYASYQGQLDAWRQQQANNQALMGGLFSLGAAGLGGWARNWGKK